jgi:hypothetical protein
MVWSQAGHRLNEATLHDQHVVRLFGELGCLVR